jgi:hypothetical protein
MSYNINRADGTNLLVLTDNTVNTKYSVTFIGKMVPNYGTAVNTNFLRLLENSAAATAPLIPVRGQLWYDTAQAQLKYYTGTVFRPLTSLPSNTTGSTALLASDTSGNYSWITLNSLFTDTIVSLGNISGTTTIDRSRGNIFKATATGNFILAISNCNAGQSFTLIITQDSTGGRTATYPSAFKFTYGYKTLSTAAGTIDMLNVFYDGTTYYTTLTAGYAA